MSPDFTRGVSEELTNARITFDKFCTSLACQYLRLDKTARIDQRTDKSLKGTASGRCSRIVPA